MTTKEEILKLGTRKKIYEEIRQNPGCHLRAIQRSVKLSFGLVTHHVSYLKKYNLIKEKKNGKNNLYFPSELNNEEQKILTLLRQNSLRKILLTMILDKEITNNHLSSRLKLSPSTISWHLKKLEENQVIKQNNSGIKTIYVLLVDKKTIVKLLIAYKESFLDSLVNSVIELVDL